MFDRHTAINQVNSITKVMDVINFGYCDKLIGLSSDGENTMTGCRGGVITLLEQQATNSVIMHVWCPEHKMDLFMKAGLAMIDDGQFVEGTNR